MDRRRRGKAPQTLRQKDRAWHGRSGEKALAASPKEHAERISLRQFLRQTDRGGMDHAVAHALEEPWNCQSA